MKTETESEVDNVEGEVQGGEGLEEEPQPPLEVPPPAEPGPSPPPPPPPPPSSTSSSSGRFNGRVDPGGIGRLQQTGHLVMGPGARKDTLGLGLLGGALPKLTVEEQAAVQRAKKYAMEQSIKMVLMKQTHQHQQAQARSLQRHQAVVLMCRVYVGSINFEVREDTIRQAFLPFGPIRSISMSWDPVTQKHKGFAFVEYEMPEAAQLALEQMNGVIISGRNIKVGRPSNMPQAQAVIDEIVQEAKKYSRIYVASIHPDLTEDDIKSVFEAFGPIKSCELAKPENGSAGPNGGGAATGLNPATRLGPGSHKGYCFIEYDTEQAAMDAIASMNLFDLGGQYLRVGRSNTPPETKNMGPPACVLPQAMPTAAAVAAAAATAKIQAMDAVASNLGLSSADLTLGSMGGGDQLASSSAGMFADPPVAMASSTMSSTIQAAPAAPPLPAPVSAASSFAEMGFAAIPPPGVVTLAPSVTGQVVAVTAAATTTDAAEDLAKGKQQQEEAAAAAAAAAAMAPQSLQQQENASLIKGTSARHLVMQKLMRGPAESPVVLLRNMVAPEEVDEELQDEISEECGKYGEVERVIIYQEKQSEADDAPVVVKIFVEFKDPASAKTAKQALNGRFFGGRIIVADIYDQDLFEHGDLSG